MVGGKSDVSGETEGCDEWVKSIVAYSTFSTVPSQRANLCFRTNIKLVLDIIYVVHTYIQMENSIPIPQGKPGMEWNGIWNLEYSMVEPTSNFMHRP